MAVLTPVAKSVKFNTAGRYKEVQLDVAALNDGDTLKVPTMASVVRCDVELTGANVVAADSAAVASISGDTVTFQVAGTARPARIVAVGA